jgi:hypothetical protein
VEVLLGIEEVSKQLTGHLNPCYPVGFNKCPYTNEQPMEQLKKEEVDDGWVNLNFGIWIGVHIFSWKWPRFDKALRVG